MLSVPIPSSKEYRLNVKYFPYNLLEQPLDFIFNVGEMVSASEIRQKVLDNLPQNKKNIQLFITRVRDKSSVEIISKDKLISSKSDKSSEICVYERINLPE